MAGRLLRERRERRPRAGLKTGVRGQDAGVRNDNSNDNDKSLGASFRSYRHLFILCLVTSDPGGLEAGFHNARDGFLDHVVGVGQ